MARVPERASRLLYWDHRSGRGGEPKRPFLISGSFQIYIPTPSIEWWDREPLIEWPSVIEMLCQTKRTFDSIRNLTELSHARLSNKEFGEFCYRSIEKDIGEATLLLEGFLKFLVINTPLKKKDTVHNLIEEGLKQYRVQLEEKGIKLSKTFEENLPETIIPDEPLKFILNSILQYGVTLVTPHGDMGFLTHSFILQGEEGADPVELNKAGRYIEIELFFTGSKRLDKPFEESRVSHKVEPLDLLLRLVKEVVRKNRGIMKFETDGKKGRTSLSVKFPCERREIVHFKPVNQFMN
jgi:hypothetical protein